MTDPPQPTGPRPCFNCKTVITNHIASASGLKGGWIVRCPKCYAEYQEIERRCFELGVDDR